MRKFVIEDIFVDFWVSAGCRQLTHCVCVVGVVCVCKIGAVQYCRLF